MSDDRLDNGNDNDSVTTNQRNTSSNSNDASENNNKSNDRKQETPDRKVVGTVQERVEYFQARQNEAEARRLQEEELFNSRTRSPPTPQHIPEVEDAKRNTDEAEDSAALSPSIHVPSLVHEFEDKKKKNNNKQSSLTQPAVPTQQHRLYDPRGWFGKRQEQSGNPQVQTQNDKDLVDNNDDEADDDADISPQHKTVDDMILEADQLLTSRSNSLEGLFRKVDQNLNSVQKTIVSFDSSGSDYSQHRDNTSMLERELKQAEQQYARAGLEMIARQLDLNEEEVLIVLESEASDAESMERTKAMMARDDVVPSSSNYENRDKPNTKRTLPGPPTKNGLIMRSFPSPPAPSSRKGKSTDPHDNKSADDKFDIVHKQAFFEVPVEVTDNGGLKLTPKMADLTMMTTIPPSRLGGAWSGSVAGKSSIGAATESSGSAMLEYKASRWTRLSMGLTRGFQREHNLLTIGCKMLSRGGSYLGIGLYHHPTNWETAWKIDHWLWSCSYRHSFANSRWYFFSQLSRRQDVLLILSNNKLSGRIGWNLRKASQLMLRLDARPRLSEYRKAHLYCEWKNGVWQTGLSLIQSLHSQVATVGLGWRILGTRGVQWIFSWNRGNATINIPVLISKELTNASFGHVLYVSLVSYLIQESVGEMWGWVGQTITGTAETSPETKNVLVGRHSDPEKLRKDAETQRELMTRQAKRKMKIEQEKDGLVIQEAVYQVKDGDKVDVTAQLQFWVTHSTLTLPARPKSELLGFYNVVASSQKPEPTTIDKTSATWSWSDVWSDLLGIKNTRSVLGDKHEKSLPIPELTIRYTFKQRSYRVTIKDRDELRLPSPQATVEE
ncbi:protein of unknown function DUF3395 containing protein [Nitzschia inconspicua]|uniref:DnaJ-like protein C11 C-terminal domain-containing protein n=1 Tax=Nitzschia inconspicua TaxID=303405 RepID=A0A9K3Q8S8_9STRA|nr:protein of unknown function DUF3395 containing protein [Nitzschia inconspicua]